MSLFKDMLKDSETLFKNSVALDYDFIPKLIPYRENQQHFIANCIKPLFQQRNGRNCIVHGPPGIGKTVALKKVLQDLEEQTDEIEHVYINCWQKNSSYKIAVAMCEKFGYKLTSNKKTDELFAVLKNMLNKSSTVFVFDEIDKVEDYNFLYFLLEDIYRASILMVTNFQNWITDLDGRIKSRLTPELLEFKPYNLEETKGIIKERASYAFLPSVWPDEELSKVINRTYEIRDIRTGLYLLRESTTIAEDKSLRKVTSECVDAAIAKLQDYSKNEKTDLEDDTKFILEVVKQNTNKRIGELFEDYQKAGGKGVYKTFQRKIKSLSDSGYISVEKVTGGSEGSTTFVKYNAIDKKLTEF
jgi:archaeal cell division control protein 6